MHVPIDRVGFATSFANLPSPCANMSGNAAAPQNPAVLKDRKGLDPWRGTKPAGFILHPELFMKECVGLDVSIRLRNGAKWKGVLQEVRDNGDVVIKPAQELLYDELDGPELAEKLLVKSDILWLRRHLKDTDNVSSQGSMLALNQPQEEPFEAPSPTKNNQQP
ncbi:hypothetical protein PPTG_15970 [Phytophthora nicotianae INRA-310]|uniref:Uncharacterized protein n=2 Tax=Phytophthora nicotianae TaxID=4792 RepID=W2PUU1_PHYN3|nr:hypothetical protein PPTG_15970 [Phytophthora nicotianae INRA-310]ETN03775.1 hypothetical protein PPTG_15970 [Phytophthora nicotianae INRA-310]